MTNLNRSGSGDISAINTSNGALVAVDSAGEVTLANGVTYVFPLGSSEAPVSADVPLAAIHLRWDAAVIVTFTIESCNFPLTKGGIAITDATKDVTDHDTTAGNWIQENPSGVYVGGAGGLTVTNLTLAVAGGTAGGAMIHLGNLGSRRVRVKAVVGGTGGKVRCNVRGKGPK